MSARPLGHGLITRVRTLLVLVAIVAALGTAAAVAAAAASAATSADYFFISSLGPTYAPGHYFGESGAGPNGIATDSAGNVYVTIPQGFVKYYASGVIACVYAGDNGYTAGYSYGLDVDANGNVYYADRTNHLIAKLHPADYGVSGYVYHWVSLTGKDGSGTPLVYGDGGDLNIGTGNGEFNFPNDVAVDGHYLWVTDTLNNRIQKFETATGDGSLSFVGKWGRNLGDGTSGSGNGEFSQPRGIDAQDGVNGHIFVADTSNRRVQELTNTGAFFSKFGSTTASDPLYLLDAIGLDVDTQGDVYVTDLGDSTSWVGKFRSTAGVWSRVTRIGGFGAENAQFYYPWSSVVDPNGYLYVTDTQNNRLKKFARDATPPTVTPAGFPAGWTKTIGDPELTASDPTVAGQYTSNGVSIWYSKTGGAPWTAYHEPFSPGGFVEGDNSLTYFARDAVGNESTPATLHVLYDKTAPVTTPSGVPNGWSNANVSVALAPGDDGRSAIASTQYRVQGAATWTTYSGPFTVSSEGASDYEYRSTDAAGNIEAARTLTVSIDKTAPVTAITDVPAGWSRTAVTATFSPGDTPSGVASTEYSTNGGATWAPGLSAAITGQGVTTLLVRSTDVAGNVENPKTATVRIDGTAPVPKALANKSVKRNATVKLQYKIADVPDAQAKVTIKIYKGKALKKKLTVGTKAANVNLTYSYKCKLPKGKYSWKVSATDLAGNAQAKPGVRTLTVT